MTRLDGIAIVAVGVLALACRLAVHAQVPLSAPVADMAEYWERAAYIAEHGRLYENSWRMPGYPVALAAAFRMADGPSLEVARLFNAAAGALTAILTYGLARRNAGPRPSLMAALVVALYPSLLVYTTFVATEAVVGVPILGALIAATYPSMRAALIAGLCAGATTLVRPAGVALLPAVLVACAGGIGGDGRERRSWRAPALALAAFVLAMTPWWLHNARLHGRFVPLDTTGGLNLLIGSGPLANGHWEGSTLSQLHADYFQHVDSTTPAGADVATRAALAHIRAHPTTVLRLVPAKVTALLAVEGREHASLYSSSYFGPQPTAAVWVWGWAIMAAFPALLIAALLGAAVRGGVTPSVLVPCVVFLVTSVTMHLISFGDPRFHLPLVPVLAVLTTGLARWRSGFERWRLALAVLFLAWLAGAWATQLATYVGALRRLGLPNGWNTPLSFDDLL